MDAPPAPRDRFDPSQTTTLLQRARAAFVGRRVVVVGDAILDCYRHADGRSRCYAGGAAVIAAHLKALGAEPTLVTLIGRDGDSVQLKDCLGQMDLACEALPERSALPVRNRRVHGTTITATPRLELFAPPPPEAIGRVAGTVAELRTGIDAAVFVDFGYGTVCPALLDELLPILRPSVGTLAGDVSGPRVSLLAMRGFDLLTPTEAELRRLTPSPTPAAPLDQLAARVRADLGTAHLLVTRDRHGCVRFDADGTHTASPSAAGRVVDEVGAGDALLATTTLALSAGLGIDDATLLGQWAAAAALAQVGNAPVGWERLRRAALPVGRAAARSAA